MEDQPAWKGLEQRLTGVLVTCPLEGQFVGAVFVDPERPLYMMHRELFRILDDPTMTRSRHIRMEEFFEFGQVLTFMGGNGFVLGIVQADQKTYESIGEDNKLLMENVCIFHYADDYTTICYSTLFGEIRFDFKSLNGRPTDNVAIRMYVHVNYVGPNECHYTAVRFKCIEPADATSVSSAPWNKTRIARIVYADSEDEDPIFGGSSRIRESTLYTKNGTVVGRDVQDRGDKHSIVVKCRHHPREKFVIGFLKNADIDLKKDDRIQFDAFWNDSTSCYIIHEYRKL